MKKTFLSLTVLASFAALVAFTGCKKDAAPLNLQQQITGKWTLQSAVGYYVVMGNARRDTTYYSPADYFQFNADGSLTIHEGTNDVSGKWKIENDKLMISETNYMDYPNGFALSVITNNNLQLYYTEQDQVSTLEQKLNLAK